MSVSLAGMMHDNSAKLILLKAYTMLIGTKATTLLLHLCNSLEQEFRVSYDEDGVAWHEQNLKWMSFHTTLPMNTLRRARQVLIDLGFIRTKQAHGFDRTTLWSVCEEKLGRFYLFAHALRYAVRPENTYTLQKWVDWAAENPDIVQEFADLWPNIDELTHLPKMGGCISPKRADVLKNNTQEQQSDYVTKNPADSNDVVMRRTKKPRGSFNIHNGPDLGEPKAKPKSHATCPYVEYWNSLPHVPKCRPNTQTYTKAKQFFEAHRRYNIGKGQFFLDSAEKERLQLAKVNIAPLDAQRNKAGDLLRPHEQMLAHIEKAALTYDPEYFPQDKKWLPRSLPQFLYNTKSKKYGQTSLFIERLVTRPAQPLSECTYDGLMAAATDAELDVLAMVKSMYDLANGRESTQELDLREFKQALSVSRNILKEYTKIPVERVDIFASHFGDWREFMQWWQRYTEDHIWTGMPITAMDVGKNMWRAFVDFVSDDIGYHLISGRRV